jgi:hypothetical protein
MCFIDKPFNTQIQDKASYFMTLYTRQYSLSSHSVKKICQLLRPPSSLSLTGQEQLMQSLKNLVQNKVLKDGTVTVIRDISAMLNDVTFAITHKTDQSTKIDLMFSITNSIIENYSNLYAKKRLSGKIIYSILVRLLDSSDNFIVFKSLQNITKSFRMLYPAVHQSYSEQDDFHVVVHGSGLLFRLRQLIVHQETDPNILEAVLDVLIIVTYGPVASSKAVAGLGFLPFFRTLLDEHKAFGRVSCLHAVLRNIAAHKEFHPILTEYGIISAILLQCFKNQDSAEVSALKYMVLISFAIMNVFTFRTGNDIHSAQQRLRIILLAIREQSNAFFEQTVISAVKNKIL